MTVTMEKVCMLLLLMTIEFCGQQSGISKVNFLLGTWQIEGKQTYESWKMQENKMIGESYKVKDDQKYISETLEIKETEGKVIYTATVMNQNGGKGIPFELVSVKDQLYSFENSTHDFPNKIQYKILSKTELQVNVFGKDGKGFSYKLMKQL